MTTEKKWKFGKAITRWALKMWRAWGRNSYFQFVVFCGAPSGSRLSSFHFIAIAYWLLSVFLTAFYPCRPCAQPALAAAPPPDVARMPQTHVAVAHPPRLPRPQFLVSLVCTTDGGALAPARTAPMVAWSRVHMPPTPLPNCVVAIAAVSLPVPSNGLCGQLVAPCPRCYPPPRSAVVSGTLCRAPHVHGVTRQLHTATVLALRPGYAPCTTPEARLRALHYASHDARPRTHSVSLSL